MVPLYGLAAATENIGNLTEFVAMTIFIAQLAMIVVSFVAMRMGADTIGAWPENRNFGTQFGPNRNGKPTS